MGLMRMLLAISMLLGVSAWAAEPAYFFLEADSIDPKTVIVPPPLSDSAQDAQDMKDVVKRQADAHREKACNRARAVGETITLQSTFGQVLTAEEVARWNELFLKIQSDQKLVRKPLKELYQRPRPFEKNREVIPCVTLVAPSFSYPSGHSTMAHLGAAVLSLLDPAREAAFDAMADQIAEDRVTTGVHYPTDIVAGGKLAQAIVGEFKKNPNFRAEIERLKKPTR